MLHHWRDVWNKNPIFFIAMTLLLTTIAFVSIIAIWILIVIGSQM